MPIPQSNVIFFYLFAAFFVFITMRGELRKYMGFLLSTPTPAPQRVNIQSGASVIGAAMGNPAVIGSLY
ncbi:MAG: hypothetical protein KGJ13_08225 [Patescibacteria group bacterium]|nr:hypothetical protein [Patescibacteria group bacterium]